LCKFSFNFLKFENLVQDSVSGHDNEKQEGFSWFYTPYMLSFWLTMYTEHGFPLWYSSHVVFYNVWLCSATFLVLSHAAIAVIYPLFVEEGRQIDHEHKSVAAFAEISSPQQLEQFQILEEQADKVVVNLLDWQVFIAHLFHNVICCHKILCKLSPH